MASAICTLTRTLMPTRNISLTTQFDSFVEQNVREGEFANASEVIRAGLQLLKHRQEERMLRLERLRAAATVGFDALDRGEYVEIGNDQFLRDHIAAIGREARQRCPVKRREPLPVSRLREARYRNNSCGQRQALRRGRERTLRAADRHRARRSGQQSRVSRQSCNARAWSGITAVSPSQ